MSELERIHEMMVATPDSMVAYTLDARNSLIVQIEEIKMRLKQAEGALVQVNGILAALEDSARRAKN